jgi:hypothetical protein
MNTAIQSGTIVTDGPYAKDSIYYDNDGNVYGVLESSHQRDNAWYTKVQLLHIPNDEQIIQGFQTMSREEFKAWLALYDWLLACDNSGIGSTPYMCYVESNRAKTPVQYRRKSLYLGSE